MEHRIVNKLHILDYKGRIHVFTEKEYEHLTWWALMKLKYNLK